MTWIKNITWITKTWLLDGIHNSKLFDGRYFVWRRDRNYAQTSQSFGRGVLIAVRKDLSVIEKYEWRSFAEDVGDVWVILT